MFKLKLKFFLQMDLVRMTNNQGSKDRWGNCSNSFCPPPPLQVCIPLNSIRSPAGQMSPKKEKWVVIPFQLSSTSWSFLPFLEPALTSVHCSLPLKAEDRVPALNNNDACKLDNDSANDRAKQLDP